MVSNICLISLRPQSVHVVIAFCSWIFRYLTRVFFLNMLMHYDNKQALNNVSWDDVNYFADMSY